MSSTEKLEVWLANLESGQYQQGTGCLRKDPTDPFGLVKHCCLGVGCDVSGLGKWVNRAWDDPSGVHGSIFVIHKANPTEAGDRYVFPCEVANLYGFATCRGAFDFKWLPQDLRLEILKHVEYEPKDLVDLNDAGVPFPVIAKVIRARPKGLFRE